ncbi:MAG: hypothetical protein JW787_11115 [Sedimentisphaerales bacterium]|nr:hypothetical protein [Sedimentisphaerales bacterium]
MTNDYFLTRNDVFRSSHLPNSNDTGISTGRRVAKARHKKGCNVLFLDWHADFTQAEDIVVDMWLFKK